MEQKTSLRLVLLLLLLVFLVSSDALPISRSLRMFNDEEMELAHDSQTQGIIVDVGVDSQMSQISELVDRRMDMETMDYPGTGANNHHDPRNPGLV